MAVRDGAGRFAGKDSAAGIAAALEKQVAKTAVALALQIDRNLRRAPSAGGTPVDTGHARANWVPSVGVPHTSDVDSDSAHAAGVAAVIGYQLGSGPIYVSNAAKYVERLNMGSSQQAPAGFVERCIDEAEQAVQAKMNTPIGMSSTSADDAGGRAAVGIADAYSPFGGD